MTIRISSLLLLFMFAASQVASAQNPQAKTNVPVQTPATKIEAFQPAAGSVLTLGYDNLGTVGRIAVEVREMKDSKGGSVKGLIVDITESEYRKERAFIDTDEISELLKGMDALMQVSANPTQFKNFEVRYTTRGQLQLTAFNTGQGDHVVYAVQAGRISTAQNLGLELKEMQKLKDLFASAQQKLASLQ